MYSLASIVVVYVALVRVTAALDIVALPIAQGSDDGPGPARSSSPRCWKAADHDRVPPHKDMKFAVVTSIRSAEYLIAVRDLHCSLQRTNPDLPLVVLGITEELENDVVNEIEGFATYRLIPNIRYGNTLNPQHSKNWFKLNVWNLTEYDAVVMLDAESIVLENVGHVFHLPTDFAWSYLNGPFYDWNKGGVIMLRPCQQVLQHMLDILEQDETKHFVQEFAEQSFLSWYFEYTGFRLPSTYTIHCSTLMTKFYNRHTDSFKAASAPIVAHFAGNKHFDVDKIHPHWQHMCHQYHALRHRYSPSYQY